MIAAIQLHSGQGPISDLFGGSPQLPEQTAQAPSPGGGTNWFVVVLLVGVLGYLTWLRFDEGVGPRPGPKPDDEKRQVQPDGGKVAAKGCWVVIVEETADRKNFPHIATVQNDLDYWAGLKSRGITWHFYDRDSKDIAPYLADAEKAGLPALLVISPGPNAKVLAAKSCPPTTESINEIVNGVIAK